MHGKIEHGIPIFHVTLSSKIEAIWLAHRRGNHPVCRNVNFTEDEIAHLMNTACRLKSPMIPFMDDEKEALRTCIAQQQKTAVELNELLSRKLPPF